MKPEDRREIAVIQLPLDIVAYADKKREVVDKIMEVLEEYGIVLENQHWYEDISEQYPMDEIDEHVTNTVGDLFPRAIYPGLTFRGHLTPTNNELNRQVEAWCLQINKRIKEMQNLPMDARDLRFEVKLKLNDEIEDVRQWANTYLTKVQRRKLMDIMNDADIEMRQCDQCGDLMLQGYVIEGGAEYYCDEECFALGVPDEAEREDLLADADGDGETYWTEWTL